ncbi:MAG TPA: DUF4390 domain-containing protein [Burkholderiales bacterium]|nr:DUF4390 domain-containing protein [Burkholderiales bacterium]
MRRIASFTWYLIMLASLALPAAANEVEHVALRAEEAGFLLDADFSFELTPRLQEAVENGVPLYFAVDFELGRRRWYWFDEETASKTLRRRLSYHPLSRQYRVSAGLLHINFDSLREALDAISRVRNWLVVDRTVTFVDDDYQAAVRLRLDTTLLPKPFQVSALTSRDLQLETPWKRFVLHSPAHVPAPVEARKPAASSP